MSADSLVQQLLAAVAETTEAPTLAPTLTVSASNASKAAGSGVVRPAGAGRVDEALGPIIKTIFETGEHEVRRATFN